VSTAFLATLAADAGIFTGDFGQTVTNGASSAPGLLSIRDRVVDEAGFQTVRRSQVVRMKTGAGGTIESGTILVIDGAKHRVDVVEVVAPDGVFTDYWLAGGVS
jgi:hypothetical protein